jgi:hypothetical protein
VLVYARVRACLGVRGAWIAFANRGFVRL